MYWTISQSISNKTNVDRQKKKIEEEEEEQEQEQEHKEQEQEQEQDQEEQEDQEEKNCDNADDSNSWYNKANNGKNLRKKDGTAPMDLEK